MPKGAKAEKIDLEKSFAELEKLTEQLQSGNLDLEGSLKNFERGLELAEQIKIRLAAVENRMETIRLKYKQTLGQEKGELEENDN